MLVAPSGALTHEVHTIGVDGTNDAVVGTLEIGSGTEVFFPDAELFDGTTVYFQPNGRSMAPGSWRYQRTSGTIGLVAAADEGAPFSAQPVGVRTGLMVTADREASGRVSIASVESLSRGEAAWSTITGIGPGTPSNDLDRDVTTVTWPTADRIHVELLDRPLAVAVGDA